MERNQIINAMKAPLGNDKRKFTQIDAGAYFYVSYLPQFPAILLGKILNLNVLHILYLGRVFALLFYIFCVWYALKTIPIGKYLLMTIALLPICLAQAASYNADCVLFSFSFIGIALLLKYSLRKEPVEINMESILLLGILAVMGVLKPIYLPFSLLIFILPRKLFNNNLRFFTVTGLTVLCSIILTIAWLKFDAPGTVILPENINPSQKVDLIINNPMVVFDILGQTLRVFHESYYKSTIGVLGYLDTFLPESLYATFAILILFLTLFESDRNYKLLIYQRILLFIVACGIFVAAILGLYLYSRSQTGFVAEGVQGRYFIPALFPFLISLYGLIPLKINFSKNQVMIFILTIELIVLLLITQLTILERYYG